MSGIRATWRFRLAKIDGHLEILQTTSSPTISQIELKLAGRHQYKYRVAILRSFWTGFSAIGQRFLYSHLYKLLTTALIKSQVDRIVTLKVYGQTGI